MIALNRIKPTSKHTESVLKPFLGLLQCTWGSENVKKKAGSSFIVPVTVFGAEYPPPPTTTKDIF